MLEQFPACPITVTDQHGNPVDASSLDHVSWFGVRTPDLIFNEALTRQTDRPIRRWALDTYGVEPIVCGYDGVVVFGFNDPAEAVRFKLRYS